MSRHSITPFHQEPEENARTYVARNNLQIVRKLGWGKDGVVFSTTNDTAIKALAYTASYEYELSVYLRLHELKVKDIYGFSVPKFVNYDNALRVIEMGIVSPPCVYDFAGAYLDGYPDYLDEEQMAEWHKEIEERFEERYSVVQSVLSGFRRYKIYLMDVTPNNIRFEES